MSARSQIIVFGAFAIIMGLFALDNYSRGRIGMAIFDVFVVSMDICLVINGLIKTRRQKAI